MADFMAVCREIQRERAYEASAWWFIWMDRGDWAY
jgi:hypothetical protein